MTKIMKLFLERQYQDGMAFGEASDLVELRPIGVAPYERYIATFFSRGLVQHGGEIVVARNFVVGIQFPPDYQQHVQPWEVLTWLGPMSVFHPNIRGPFMCIGSIVPGTGLVDLLYQCYETIGYSKVTMDENDALNHEACVWARRNQSRFPIEDRPLKRRNRSATDSDPQAYAR